MSETTTSVRFTPQEFAAPAVIGRMRTRAAAVGVVALVVVLALAFRNWDLFLRSWLFAFMFWLGPTTGAFCLLCLQYTSGGNWGRLGRRIWEAAASNLWLMVIFWIPIALGLKSLYPWARYATEADAVKELGQKAHLYLNATGFRLRGLVFFAVWGLILLVLRRWANKEEAGQTTPQKFVAIQNLSGFGIVFYAAAITFLSIDLTMSLDPKWWSTVWGMLFMVGQVLTTFCFTIWLLVKLAPIEPMSKVFKTEYLHDFGKLMFAFVVLWAYLSFSQWIIIWSGNLQSEISWYLTRLNSGWQYFGTILIFAHFVFPFALLLSRSIKRTGRVAAIALFVMFMRMVDLFWLTAPNFYQGYGANAQGLTNFHLMDGLMYVLCPIAMGGIWLFFFYWQLGRRAILPVNDPDFAEMMQAGHHG